MSYEFVRCEQQAGILHITLNRAECLNALHAPAHAELASVFDDFERDPSLRVAILSGHGRAFCAGNDLKWQANGGSMERPPTGFAGLTLRHHRTKPVIAAVNGVALGGGCEIVLAADLAVAGASAKFGLTETRYGLVPLAGMHLLPRRIGLKQAYFLLLTGRVVGAEQAATLGLINEVVADEHVLARALEIAQWIVDASPSAIKACMQIVGESLTHQDIEEATSAPYPALGVLRASHDFLEGPKAFAEKRKPEWKL